MARKLIEYKVSDSDVVSYSNYNSTKTVLGPMIKKYTGVTESDYYIAPPNLGWDNIPQDTGLSSWYDFDVIRYDDRYDLAFFNYYVSSTTNRIAAYRFDKTNQTYSYLGYIYSTFSHPSNTGINRYYPTIKPVLDFYTAGTVSVNGGFVSGTGMNWGSDLISSGSRIGFGSTNPTEITNWYTISNTPLETKTFNGPSSAVKVDSEGNIYVGGSFTTYTYYGSAYTANRIIKLKSDGTIDTTFSGGTGFDNIPRYIKIDPTNSSKIYIAGDFTTYNGVTVNRICRLNIDGSLDTTFSGGTGVNAANTGFNAAVYGLDIDSQGRIIVCGPFTTYVNGSLVRRLCRLNYNGSLDTTFSGYSGNGLYYTTTPANTASNTVSVEPNTDKVYVGGLFNQWGGVTTPNSIVRLNTNGTVDTTFSATTTGTTGFVAGATVHTCLADSTGVYVGGVFTSYSGITYNYLLRLNSNSTRDTSFDSYNALAGGLSNYVIDIEKDPITNNLYVLGNFTTYKGANTPYFLRLTPNGSLDSTFSPETYTGSRGWVSPFTALGKQITINNTNGNIYLSNAYATASTLIPGIYPCYSGGSINQEFFGLNNNLLKLTTTATTYPSGTPYVIEDLTILGCLFFNSTYSATWQPVSSGLYILRGLSINDFVSGGTVITTTPNGYFGTNKLNCWLPTSVNSNGYYYPASIVVDEKVNRNNQTAYVTASGNIYLYNFRTQFKINSYTSPAMSNNNHYLFGVGALGGSYSGWANLSIGTSSSSTTNTDQKCLYTTSTTQVKQILISDIQNGVNPENVATTKSMSEIPPGNTTTYPSLGSLTRAEYIPEIDRLVVVSSVGSSMSHYITKFNPNMLAPTYTNTFYDRTTYNNLSYDNSFERAFLINGRLLQNPSSNLNTPKYPDTQGSWFFPKYSEGYLHLLRPVASNENIVYSIPIAADALYVDRTNNVFITPKYVIPNLISITGLYLNTYKENGSGVFSVLPEPILMDYRTTGIDDNTGTWINFDDISDLNNLVCNNTTNNVTIQFRFRYKIAGNYCIPNRIYGFTFTYEDDTTDSHYNPSVGKSDINNRIFAWRQSSKWNTNIPNMKVRVYNADNGDIILYDTVTDSKLGTWQYSTDGNTWNTWVSSADTVGNYIRYTANYIPQNYKLRVGLNSV